MTVESFRAWKAQFDKEMAERKALEEQERLKELTPKEREEYKKAQTRLTGAHILFLLGIALTSVVVRSPTI